MLMIYDDDVNWSFLKMSKVRKFQPEEKVFVLLPTEHNKLLMQWKNSFEVSSEIGLNDYKV